MNRHDTAKRDLRFSRLPESSVLAARKERARCYFVELRDSICAAFESIEREHNGDACFSYRRWEREEGGGGGEAAEMRGAIFDKVGVNASTVWGCFSGDFASEIPGAEASGGKFWASGLSLVAHMRNPHVPAVHLNLRMLCTGACWFGGSADINGAIEDSRNTVDFHGALRSACDAHNSAYYDIFRDWCDNYFYLPHRDCVRGQGGIFYDYLDSGDWDLDFSFMRSVGEAFLSIYPVIVRRCCDISYGDAELARLLRYRGRYVEFNLLYDRGTRFGLRTGGDIDAILMSLPPLASW